MPEALDCQEEMMKALMFAGIALAALLAGASAVSAKTLVYCSEGSPENFYAGDQHDRHQLRRGAAGLQSADRIQARDHRG